MLIRPATERPLDRRGSALGILLILLVACAFRLYGIGHDLPFLDDPDEGIFVMGALRMLQRHSLDPGWFGAPASTTMYLLAGAYVTLYAVGSGLGRFQGAEGFKAFYQADPTWFYLSGRLLSAIFGVAVVWLVYRIARRLFNPPVALLSALIAALSPPLVLFSQMVRMDTQMAFFVLLAFWYSLDILESGSWRAYVLAGIFTGLATVTKYPAVTVAAVVLVAHLLQSRWRRADHWKLLSSGLGSVAAAFVGSPFLFLSFREALADIRVEARTSHLSHTGQGLFSNFAWYWTESIPRALTLVGAVLAVAGLLLCLRPRRMDRFLLALYPLIFLTFISSLNLRWDRWVLPALPFLAIVAAAAVDRLRSAAPARLGRVGVAAAALLVVGLAGGLGLSAFGMARQLGAESTRTLARHWILDHIPAGSRIATEQYTPQFPRGRYRLYVVASGRLVEVDQRNKAFANSHPPRGTIGELSSVCQLGESDVRYMVLSNLYDRYAREEERDQTIVETYEALIRSGELLFEIEPKSGRIRGPRIRVFGLRDATLNCP